MDWHLVSGHVTRQIPSPTGWHCWCNFYKTAEDRSGITPVSIWNIYFASFFFLLLFLWCGVLWLGRGNSLASMLRRFWRSLHKHFNLHYKVFQDIFRTYVYIRHGLARIHQFVIIFNIRCFTYHVPTWLNHSICIRLAQIECVEENMDASFIALLTHLTKIEQLGNRQQLRFHGCITSGDEPLQRWNFYD